MYARVGVARNISLSERERGLIFCRNCVGGSPFHRKKFKKLAFLALGVRQSNEGLTLKTSALLSFFGGNLSPIKPYDTKFVPLMPLISQGPFYPSLLPVRSFFFLLSLVPLVKLKRSLCDFRPTKCSASKSLFVKTKKRPLKLPWRGQFERTPGW